MELHPKTKANQNSVTIARLPPDGSRGFDRVWFQGASVYIYIYLDLLEVKNFYSKIEKVLFGLRTRVFPLSNGYFYS